MELDSEVYKWMLIMNVIQRNTKISQETNEKYKLDELQSKKVENGVIINQLLDKLMLINKRSLDNH